MSDKDTKNHQANANLEQKGLDGTASVGFRFNAEVERGAEIAAASDRAKQMIGDQSFVRDSRHQTQTERENKYSEYGIQKERTALLEKQLSSPQLIPKDPESRAVMQREIDEGAVRNYGKKNQFFRDQIDRQYKQNVDEILRLDRDGRLHEIDPEHSQTQEHEHELGGR